MERTGTGSGATGLLWLFGDHICRRTADLRGSTSRVANADGTPYTNGEQRYKPWGEKRYPSGSSGLPTTYRYTGQCQETGLGPGGGEGLYYYGARFYDPCIMQFTQPDSKIPDPYNPLDWNRYSYARNNPLKYIDPTGYDPDRLDYLQGAAYQIANDMTLGAVDEIAASLDVCMDCNVSDAYKQGQEAGRVVSSVVASTEFVLGAAATGAALASIPPTTSGRLVCTAVFGGTLCIAVGGSSGH